MSSSGSPRRGWGIEGRGLIDAFGTVIPRAFICRRYDGSACHRGNRSCGSGRDVAWLNDHGFPAVGYDAADGLLGQAAAAFPSLVFKRDALPALNSIGTQAYDNVLCETVLMHLPAEEVTRACERLLDILRPGGTMYLSWRVTQSASTRDGAGRLYAEFDAVQVREGLGAAEFLLDAETVNLSSGKRVHRLIARRR